MLAPAIRGLLRATLTAAARASLAPERAHKSKLTLLYIRQKLERRCRLTRAHMPGPRCWARIPEQAGPSVFPDGA